jgi:uncharacterized protein (DUF2236 family)
VGATGWFGPSSIAWRLHADPTMLVAAMRALLVQALEPRAMAGVDQHSDYRTDPWGRLNRTVEFVYATTYGDSNEAEAAVANVRRIHQHVHGVDPATGASYSADDPDLLLWVHAVETHSVITAYRRYAGLLSDRSADRYVAEMAQIAERLGLPAAMTPRTLADLRTYLRGVEGLQFTPAAREGMRTILDPPMPPILRPLWAIPTAATIAILPRFARREYRLPWPEVATPAVRAAVLGLSRALDLVLPDPPTIRRARARVRAA